MGSGHTSIGECRYNMHGTLGSLISTTKEEGREQTPMAQICLFARLWHGDTKGLGRCAEQEETTVRDSSQPRLGRFCSDSHLVFQRHVWM